MERQLKAAELPKYLLKTSVYSRYSIRCFCEREAVQQTPKAQGCDIKKRAAVASLASLLISSPRDAFANVLRDYVERSQRPEMTSQQALVMLLDARGVLSELKLSELSPQALAATAPNSGERFRARALLPGMAKSLRKVGQAAPIVIAEATGGGKDLLLSKEYGGQGDESAVGVPIYQAIGQVITISGRTIKKEAQASPDRAEAAIGKLNELLAMVPESKINEAQQLRQSRQSPGLEIKRKDVPLSAVADM